eukprot:TRINITY_DN101102_c0_g1_i1.p1 TRINITY_DN101102_c0_g1~~TRINITY_DN101102_c0_g1_i1.p1  ORF type:complete len:516 (-),score=127.30 TRINITY_DN101102_c0_g1_i1:45-1568(-)
MGQSAVKIGHKLDEEVPDKVRLAASDCSSAASTTASSRRPSAEEAEFDAEDDYVSVDSNELPAWLLVDALRIHIAESQGADIDDWTVAEDAALTPDAEARERHEKKEAAGEENGGAAAGKTGMQSGDIKDWDVARCLRGSGPMQRLTMALPMATKVVGTLIGGTLASTGYAAGKIGEAIGEGKAIDSKAFRFGFHTWLWSSGICPTVTYEPLAKGSQGRLKTKYRVEDMNLTPLIVSNHTSYLDGLILAALFGAPKVLAKAGAKQTPIFGKLMEEMDTIFVDRQDPDSRQETMRAIRGHCTSWRDGDRPLLIFPEGTVSNGEGILPFKKGAFVSGVPVRPVVIVYTGTFDPASTTYRLTKQGPVKTTDAEWFMQFLGHFIHSMHVHILRPYVPDEQERGDPGLYAANVQGLMEMQLTKLRQELQVHSWKEEALKHESQRSEDSEEDELELLGLPLGDELRAVIQRFRGKVSRGVSSIGGALDAAEELVVGAQGGPSEDAGGEPLLAC